MTVIQELISEFEEIKKTKCKTLQEVIFFDGVLAIIEGKYLKKEQEQEKNKYSEEDMIAFGKSCFYKGFDKAENDDANCYTAFREEIGNLVKQFKNE